MHFQGRDVSMATTTDTDGLNWTPTNGKSQTHGNPGPGRGVPPTFRRKCSNYKVSARLVDRCSNRGFTKLEFHLFGNQLNLYGVLGVARNIDKNKDPTMKLGEIIR